MPRGKNLQEMESSNKQSRTAVNQNARAADPMPKLTTGIPDGQTGNWEDLGGPTPDNYKPDDNSALLKDAGAGLKKVHDVVTKSAKPADEMKKMKEELELDEEDVLDEDEDLEDEDEEEYEDDEEEVEVEEETEFDSEDEDEEEEYEDDEEEVEEDFDVEEDVNALVGGEELSEEFKDKARTIFEAALRTKVKQIKETLDEQYEDRLVEEVQLMKQELIERVDAYLEYVSEEWMTENILAIENGIKVKVVENFMTGMKSLFEENYVDIPEEKYDVLEGMVEKLDEMETKLNEQIEKNVHLNRLFSESVADRIFDNVAEGLAITQREKFASLAESVEFEGEEEYKERLKTIRESYFPEKRKSSKASTSETLSEGVDYSPEGFTNDPMDLYLRTASMLANN